MTESMIEPCPDEVCLTCSDHAAPAVIVALRASDLATVRAGTGIGADPDGRAGEEISVALVDAAPGDTVLVHAGEAIAVLTRAGTGGCP